MEEVKKEDSKEKTSNMENLSQLIQDKEDEEFIFSENDLDLPTDVSSDQVEETASADEATSENTQTETTPQTQQETVGMTTLYEWFEKNGSGFDHINQVKVSIRGIDPKKTLIVAVKDGSEEKDADGNDRRVLKVFDDADIMPVLDAPVIGMDIYNNGIRIVHQYSSTVYIKTYAIKSGLICVFCNNINGKLIPYHVSRLKRKDTELVIVRSDNAEAVTAKLATQADLETLQILYKQSSKSVGELSTYQSAIDWLIERQEEITDINHHLQIDNVLIALTA